jgi:hypothetical protein
MLTKMKTRVKRTKSQNLHVIDLYDCSGWVDGHICSLRTEDANPELRKEGPEEPKWLSRIMMKVSHGATGWKNEGILRSDSQEDDSISFFSFVDRKQKKRILVDIDQQNIKENMIFTVSEDE